MSSDALFLPIHKLDDVETTTTTVPTGYADRQCDSDLENLWLDVVVVVDNSHGMTSQGLTQVAPYCFVHYLIILFQGRWKYCNRFRL